MIINKPRILTEGSQVKVTSALEFNHYTVDLWFAVDKTYGDYVTDETLDPFLLGSFLQAMKEGEDIYLKGPVSARLYYNLTHSLIYLYNLVDPGLKRVRIFPDTLISAPITEKSDYVATGFSGGIDSFSLLADHFFNDPLRDYKVTHLVYNNVGAHGIDAPVFFNKRYDKLKEFAEEQRVPFIKIDSNLYEILEPYFILTVYPRNAASVLVLQKLFGKYLFASGYTYKEFIDSDIFYSSGYPVPLEFHLLSTESMEVILAGSEYTRVEKTIQVSQLESSYKHLYVCTDTSLHKVENCSVCFKCARTLLTLDILGKLDLYKNIFDLKKFEQIKRFYIESILYDKDPFGQEILNLAADYDFRIPPVSKVLGSKLVFPLIQNVRRSVPYGLRQNIKQIVGMKKA